MSFAAMMLQSDREESMPSLKPHAPCRLTRWEGRPDYKHQQLTSQLEIVCDTGTASTPLLALSSEALMALQRREFRMPGPKVVRLEEWQAPR